MITFMYVHFVGQCSIEMDSVLLKDRAYPKLGLPRYMVVLFSEL